MDDVLNIIRERQQRAIAKIERAEKALEAARAELSDVEAAFRVVSDITGSPQSTGPATNKASPSDTVTERQANIVSLLGNGRDRGIEPKDLYAKYCAETGDDISIDTFRTTIWRMQKAGTFPADNQKWTVHSENGRYWKEIYSELFS